MFIIADLIYRLPKNNDQRNIWLDLLDLPHTSRGRVCSKHFQESDFLRKRDGHVWLKSDAHPKQVESPDETSFLVNEVEVDEDTTYDVSLFKV